tara:strand:- start:318 stop:1409 length:1092 start_codon:yes stop_codon:yes gene_type:complete
MYYLSFSTKSMGFTNQIFALLNGISHAIENNCQIIVIDKFLCDYSKNKYENISKILDLDKMNIFFKQEYNLILVDKENFDFELLNVTYGTQDNVFDITQNVKDKYFVNNKLFISKNTNFNNIQGDPCIGVAKYIWFKYKLNNNTITDKYTEILDKDIDYTNKNYIKCSTMGWPSNKAGKWDSSLGKCPGKPTPYFLDILTNIFYNNQFIDISKKQLSNVILTNKVNLIHLRLEDDAIIHWSKMNKMSKGNFKKKLENKYIQLIKEYIDKKDITILLSSSFDNKIIDFLNTNQYNYFTSKKSFEYRELNAIVDFLISKECNNVFIGNFNLNGKNGSTFSYYIYETLHQKNISYKYIDLDHILQI